MSLRTKIAIVTAVTLWAHVATAGPRKYKGFARGESLISVSDLKQLIDVKDPKLVLLAVVEPVSYMAGHIPTCVAVAETREETVRPIKEAVELHIESPRESGESIPHATATTEKIAV